MREVLARGRDTVAELGVEPGRVVIGGKSMGGRVATTLADELGVAGLVCLGYPFHPPGRPDRTRVDHLRDLDERQGIEKPSAGALTEQARAEVAEIRGKARADLAQLEILHSDRLAKMPDPSTREQEEQNYMSERARIEARCDREVAKLRSS